MTLAEVSRVAVRAAADRLRQAAESGTPCAPVRDLIGSDDVAAAYAVQACFVRDRIAAGARITGRKVGLTTAAVQAQLGVNRPDFGVLFNDMACPGGVVPMKGLLQPKLEAEVAFVLSDDLSDGELSDTRVRAAVDYATPALEIVDSRILDWDITFGDTVADNGSSARYVLGETRWPLSEFDPAGCRMSMWVGDAVVSTGDGAACMGDPFNALVWLARTAQQVGQPLRAEQVILSGALGPMVPVSPGDTARAEITGLGTVTVTFI